MAGSKSGKKLPKRTGKAQKIRMMENSHKHSIAKKVTRRLENVEQHRVNELLLTKEIIEGRMDAYPATKTQRRKTLERLKARG